MWWDFFKKMQNQWMQAKQLQCQASKLNNQDRISSCLQEFILAVKTFQNSKDRKDAAVRAVKQVKKKIEGFEALKDAVRASKSANRIKNSKKCFKSVQSLFLLWNAGRPYRWQRNETKRWRRPIPGSARMKKPQKTRLVPSFTSFTNSHDSHMIDIDRYDFMICCDLFRFMEKV